MAATVISIQNLTKTYQLGVIGTGTFRGDLQRWWAKVRGNPDPTLKIGQIEDTHRPGEIIWALKNINLEISRGEAVGIIGRNGAGKSTLLKILSRVTAPSSGQVRIKGRIASLLEVGTGFHPELTGRENIYLNGAILGMDRKEIARKFDEILDFSGIDKFVDTPVKRYSSGMYVRLAFAVAAHLEPEILVVDEVLAVGDAAFQKKCLGKMGSVAKEGRTVLFVSHNIGAINSLCNRCILLDGGKMIRDGSTSDVVESYQSHFYKIARDLSDLSETERRGSGKACFSSLNIIPVRPGGELNDHIITGDDLCIRLVIKAEQEILEANVAIIIYDSTGFRLIDVNTALNGYFLTLKAGQSAEVEFMLKSIYLKPGVYFVGLWLGRHGFEDIDAIDTVTSIMVEANLDSLKHSINFPGVYQVQFTQKVSIF